MLDLENSRVMEEIEELSIRKRWQEIRDMLLLFEPADIAAILAELPEDRLPLVYRLLPKELAAETFVEKVWMSSSCSSGSISTKVSAASSLGSRR